MYKKYSASWFKHIDFILADLWSLHIAYILACWIRFGGFGLSYTSEIYREMAIAMSLVDVLVAIMFESFTGVLKRGHFRELFETIKHAMLVIGILLLYMFALKTSEDYSRIAILLTLGLYIFFSYGFRMAYKIFRRTKLVAKRSLIVIGTQDTMEQILEGLGTAANTGITVSGIVLWDAHDDSIQEIKGIPVLANRENYVESICREWVDEVFVSLPMWEEDVKLLLDELTQMGVTVHLNIRDIGDIMGPTRVVEKVGKYTVVTSSMKFADPSKLVIKRLIDIVGGLIGCIFTLVLTIFVAPIILIQSPGPLLFKQERIGQNGKRFKMLKFRSMYMDAEERKKDLMAQNRVQDGLMFKLDWDPRIIGNKELPDGRRKSGVGEFLRKTSIDEFPQFLNVLKGDMSLVGTRPPTVDEWEKYKLHHRARLATKPGITGMWQVSGRSKITDFEEVVKLDTEYINNWGIMLDLKIMCKTVASVIMRKGAM